MKDVKVTRMKCVKVTGEKWEMLAHLERMMKSDKFLPLHSDLGITYDEWLALISYINNLREREGASKDSPIMQNIVIRDIPMPPLHLRELFEYSDKENDFDYGMDKTVHEIALLAEINNFKTKIHRKGVKWEHGYQKGEVIQIINDNQGLRRNPQINCLFKALELLFGI